MLTQNSLAFIRKDTWHFHSTKLQPETESTHNPNGTPLHLKTIHQPAPDIVLLITQNHIQLGLYTLLSRYVKYS